MIVLDASAAIESLLPSPAGHRIDKRIFSPAQSPHAPHLLDREVAQVMRRYVRDKTMSQQRGEEELEDLRDLSISRYPHDFLLPRVWELRATLTAYDAVYVALAEMLDAPLLTCDGGIASAPGSPCHHRVGITGRPKSLADLSNLASRLLIQLYDGVKSPGVTSILAADKGSLTSSR